MKQVKPKFVVIDNAGDFGDPSNDGNGYKAVTKELTFLSRLAEKHNAAILLIMHENKAGGFMGSVAYENKVRSLCFYKKTEEENVNIFKHSKHNINHGVPVQFRGDEIDVEGRKYPVWKITPLGNAVISEDMATGKAFNGKQSRCNDWLKKLLVNGPIKNYNLSLQANIADWDKMAVSRARKAIGATIVTIDGEACTQCIFETAKELTIIPEDDIMT
jgi:hypothetical protein